MRGIEVETTTPKCISDDVLRLLELLPKPGEPEFLDLQPEIDARMNECFANVQAKVARDGGEIQYGWIAWERPGALVEAEFHSVWRSPNGQMVDITPKMDGEARVLFVPDYQESFDGRPVPNIRLPLSDTPEVRSVIENAKRLDELKAQYFRNGRLEIPVIEPIHADYTDHPIKDRKPGRN